MAKDDAEPTTESTEETEKAVEEMANLVDGIDLEAVDMDLDPVLATEAMGGDRFQMVIAHQKLLVNRRANRAVGNTQQAEAADKQLAALRMSVALIDRDWPGAKAAMKRRADEEKRTLQSRMK